MTHEFWCLIFDDVKDQYVIQNGVCVSNKQNCNEKVNWTLNTKDYYASLYPRHLCRRVYSFRFSVRMFVGSLVRSLFRNVRGIYVKVFVKVSLVVYIS